jgi:Xaa-Pro aminopeptidase
MQPAVRRPKAFLKVRQKTVRQALKQLKLDALLLSETADLHYLTGFTGDDSVGLITARDVYLVTDFRYGQQAGLEAGWCKLALRDGSMSATLAQTFHDAKAARVGYEVNSVTVGQLRALEKALQEKKGEVELVGVENVLANIRKVKDDHEIDLIRKSVALAEEAFEALKPQIKPGLTENHIAGLLVLELRSRGASDASFPVIVASGANSSLPHYRPGEALVQRDQPLLIDWGASLRGYCSDLTRTLMIGRISSRMKTLYRVVLEAQTAAIRFLRPGVTTTQADTVAREIIERAGYGKEFGHGLGHGIGLQIHELPALRKKAGEEELRPGMIVTVEPGIYLPGEGGVRIEDDVLITHSGCEVLSSLPRTLEGCHIE